MIFRRMQCRGEIPTFYSRFCMLWVACTVICWGGLHAQEPEGVPAAEHPKATTPEFRLAPAQLPGKKFSSAKEILEVLGVDGSQWRNFYADRPLDTNDDEYINRLLARLPRVGRHSLFGFRRVQWSPLDLIERPQELQGETFYIRGRAKQVQKVPLLPELVERYEFKHHYRVTVEFQHDSINYEAIVCIVQIPKAWPEEGSLNEPVELNGVFLKPSPRDMAVPQLVFMASHIGWFPEQTNPKHDISADTLFLIRHGFDASSLELLKGRDLRELSEADHEPFYQMFAAIAKTSPTAPEWATVPPINIGACIGSPGEQHGRLVNVQGSVQRIERIEVDSQEIRDRFGIKHYYVLYVFVPLHEQRIKWSRSANDPNPRMFDNTFPVTVCVQRLPPELQPGANVHEPVRLSGAIFKVWAYTPQGAGKDLVQPSPMILASEVTKLEYTPATSQLANAIFGVIFLVALGLFWMVFTQFSAKPSTRKPPDSLELPTSFESPAQGA